MGIEAKFPPAFMTMLKTQYLCMKAMHCLSQGPSPAFHQTITYDKVCLFLWQWELKAITNKIRRWTQEGLAAKAKGTSPSKDSKSMPNMIASIAIIVTETGRCLNDSLSVLNQVICIGSTYIDVLYSLLLKIFLYFYVERFILSHYGLFPIPLSPSLL